MIIINSIILYFKQITHTDDFPLNGYPASNNTSCCVMEARIFDENEHFTVHATLLGS